MVKFKKTKIFSLYAPAKLTKTGETRTYKKTTSNFKKLYYKGGVYVIFKQTKKGIYAYYVGSSQSDLARAILRHFSPYSDAREQDESGGRKRVTFYKSKDKQLFFIQAFYFDKPAKELTEAELTAIVKKEPELIQKLNTKFNTRLKEGEFDADLALQEALENESERIKKDLELYKENYKDFEEDIKQDIPEPEEPPF